MKDYWIVNIDLPHPPHYISNTLHVTHTNISKVTSWLLQCITVSNNISKTFKMSSIGNPSFAPALSLFKGFFKKYPRESSQCFPNKIFLHKIFNRCSKISNKLLRKSPNNFFKVCSTTIPQQGSLDSVTRLSSQTSLSSSLQKWSKCLQKMLNK